MADLGASAAPDLHLFGGLAVVLDPVSFTLMDMVCFYCKLSGHFENMEGGGDVGASVVIVWRACGFGGGDRPCRRLWVALAVRLGGDDCRRTRLVCVCVGVSRL
ncbi:glutamine dumper 3 [Striga asiatica]|uniref:Glutamine dumper 3 n=1 Tax=Striga asiatica TaxID=4170 RepID=A0A5A7R6V4_STRAF|nr:glutamine dumper 3 [Striga asiatica]